MKQFFVALMLALAVCANAAEPKDTTDFVGFVKQNLGRKITSEAEGKQFMEEAQKKFAQHQKSYQANETKRLKQMGLTDDQARFFIENRYAVNKFMEVIDGKIVYNISKEDFMKIGLPEVIFDTMNRDCDNINKMYQNPNRNIADAEKPLQEMKEMLKKDWHGYNTVAEMVAAENK